MRPVKKLATTLREMADREHCVFSASDLMGAFGEHYSGLSHSEA